MKNTMVSEVTGSEILELVELAVQDGNSIGSVFDLSDWIEGAEVLKEVQAA